MGCLQLDTTMALYRRRDVSLSLEAEQSQWPILSYTSTTKKNPPSSPNSSHRILHTQSPYHHPFLCPANTHAAQQNNPSIASTSGLAQQPPGGQIHLSKRPRERTSERTSSARPKGVDSFGRMRSHSLHDDGLLRT
jgi:hypothetical protein